MSLDFDPQTTALHPAAQPDPGEHCSNCGTAVATDQRYCLNCGQRRAEARIPFLDVLGTRAPARPAGAVDGPPPPPPPTWPSRNLVAGGALVVLALLIGLIIGRSGKGEPTVIAQKPPVVTIGNGAATGANPTNVSTAGAVKDEWPSGTDGWTVALQSFPSTATSADIDSAKADAEGSGAKEVGVLDSSNYGSLKPGSYIVYSGVYDSKKAARKALDKLSGDFPDARVVQVSADAPSGGGGSAGPDASAAGPGADLSDAGTVDDPVNADDALQNLQNAEGDDAVKQSQKLPKTLELEGKPPPKDNKAPGGGSGGGTTIG